MPRLDLVAGGAGGVPQEAFEIAFADAAAELRLPLTEALSVPFEACRPVRDSPPTRGSGLDELAGLFEEWLILGWAHRPHGALRDPHAPRRSSASRTSCSGFSRA